MKLQPPDWLTVDGLLSAFGTHRNQAQQRYRCFVLKGSDRSGSWARLCQQIYLGDEKLCGAHAGQCTDEQRRVGGAPGATTTTRSISPSIAATHAERNAAMAVAYGTGAYSYRKIAAHSGVHLATVKRVVRRAMQPFEN